MHATSSNGSARAPCPVCFQTELPARVGSAVVFSCPIAIAIPTSSADTVADFDAFRWFTVKVLILSFIILLSFTFRTEAVRADVIAAVGAGFSFVTESDGRTIDAEQPLLIRGGYRFQNAVDVYLEYSTYSASDGNASLYVSKRHNEFLTWARHIFYPTWLVSPYLAAGAGFEYDKIQTTLGAEVSNESGSPYAMGALAGGMRIAFWQPLDLQIEGRATFAGDNSTNPTLGCNFLLGVSF